MTQALMSLSSACTEVWTPRRTKVDSSEFRSARPPYSSALGAARFVPAAAGTGRPSPAGPTGPAETAPHPSRPGQLYAAPPAQRPQAQPAARRRTSHCDTDLTATPSACAAPAFDIPSAQAKAIRARSARQRPALRTAHQLRPLASGFRL